MPESLFGKTFQDSLQDRFVTNFQQSLGQFPLGAPNAGPTRRHEQYPVVADGWCEKLIGNFQANHTVIFIKNGIW
jgi:hypothetical protein